MKTNSLFALFALSCVAVLGIAGPSLYQGLLALGRYRTPAELLTPGRTELFFLLRAADLCVALFLLGLLALWLFLWGCRDGIGTPDLKRARDKILSFVRSH